MSSIHILDKIINANLPELATRKQTVPLATLGETVKGLPAPLDFAAALKGDSIKLIAEVKKASPSKGVIRADFDPLAIARTYAENGANAVSVLTENKYFQGNLSYLWTIRQTLGNTIPLLRKDFIHDPYQVYEARVYRADAILLIVAMLTAKQLHELLTLSHQLGMACLVEVHNKTELYTALRSGAEIIGINNRNLKTFKVDIKTTEKLRPLVPADKIVVSESGIHSRDDIAKLKELGVNAVLVGEAFMAAGDIGAKMRELL